MHAKPPDARRPPQSSRPTHTRRSWTDKFIDAFRGFGEGVRGQSSFVVHFAAAAAVLLAAAVLRLAPGEWCLLILCIAMVLAAEMFNSALESLAKAIDDRPNPHVGRALNIASAAVLIAAAGAATVGTIIFARRLFGVTGGG